MQCWLVCILMLIYPVSTMYLPCYLLAHYPSALLVLSAPTLLCLCAQVLHSEAYVAEASASHVKHAVSVLTRLLPPLGMPPVLQIT